MHEIWIEQCDANAEIEEGDELEEEGELVRESPAAPAKRALQFATIKELLTAAELGTW
jgi:hypothetical protein